MRPTEGYYFRNPPQIEYELYSFADEIFQKSKTYGATTEEAEDFAFEGIDGLRELSRLCIPHEALGDQFARFISETPKPAYNSQRLTLQDAIWQNN